MAHEYPAPKNCVRSLYSLSFHNESAFTEKGRKPHSDSYLAWCIATSCSVMTFLVLTYEYILYTVFLRLHIIGLMSGKVFKFREPVKAYYSYP